MLKTEKERDTGSAITRRPFCMCQQPVSYLTMTQSPPIQFKIIKKIVQGVVPDEIMYTIHALDTVL